jgi:hypothetical protein
MNSNLAFIIEKSRPARLLRRGASTVGALLMVVIAACDSVANYSGDGKLTDNGIFAATDRYVLDLGPVALKNRAEKKYRLENLPKESFVVGIEIRPTVKDLASLERKPINAVVSLSLAGSDGKQVFTVDSKLSAWTWNLPSTADYAFIYVRNDPGTYFTPASNSSYDMTLKILQPDSGSLQYEARILAKSGGWK